MPQEGRETWKGNFDLSFTLAKSPCHRFSSKTSILCFPEMAGPQVHTLWCRGEMY